MSLVDCRLDDVSCKPKTCGREYQINLSTNRLSTQACKEQCDTDSECKYFLSYFVPHLDDMVCITYKSCASKEESNYIRRSRNYGAIYRKVKGKNTSIV